MRWSSCTPVSRTPTGGPDFFNARLRIGETVWAGNVEIHLRASHWFRHGHQFDHAYDNAILHVVYESDAPVYGPNGEPLQTLVVRDRFPLRIYDRYREMMENRQWIPCFNQLSTTPGNGFNLWAPALAVERLAGKSLAVKQQWERCRNDWEEALYLHLASTFGMKINSLPFELLAKSLPLRIVRKHLDSLFQLEALYFGQSGLLENGFGGGYPADLLNEYQYLRKKYDLKPIPGSTWKFLRLRPVNFPTLRISQWAGFIYNGRLDLLDILECSSARELAGALNAGASPYWDTHYVFGKASPFRKKLLGKDAVYLLMINGIVPFMFFHGLEKDQPVRRETALNILEQIPGEQNAQVGMWETAGMPVVNALQTQALIHLKKTYCDRKRCLDCRIGNFLLEKN